MKLLVRLLMSGFLLCASSVQAADDELHQTKLEDLGRALFFDVNLSLNRTQSCATCHDPARAFIDWRDSGVGAAASLGDDMHSLGDRHAPTASYAALSPEFQRNSAGEYVGGQFWDGRASTLEQQAEAPPLNPLEMGMPDKLSVLERLQENANYLHAFKNLFGEEIFADAEFAYAAMAKGIAAFERSEFFSPFDSKYDRYLTGDYEPTEEEELGITLFFSNQFTNCNQCHQLQALPEALGETFTNYTYQNIGVPSNLHLREMNGMGIAHVDRGLLDNPDISDLSESGKFKVPTLRNVVLTAPYMHNGVFRDLETILRFYNKYLTRSSKAQINPETGERWESPEVEENLALELLEQGRVIDERGIRALMAFLAMLTDKRYEPLLEFSTTTQP